MAQPGKQSRMVEPGGEAPVAREWHCAAGLLDCVVVVKPCSVQLLLQSKFS